MARAAAKTGIMPTALVAVEQSFPRAQRVIDDPFAIRMLPPGARLFVAALRLPALRDALIRLSEKSDPGIWGGLLCRKRYIDDHLVASRSAIAAAVNLGAGFDTRALRLPAIANLPTWELDQLENIQAKTTRLRHALGVLPPNLHLVATDFDRDNLDTLLAAHGYPAAQPTFFIWEAVMQYLTEPGVRATFAWLAHAAPGSRLAFTYVRRSFLEGRELFGWESGYKRFVATRVWLFAMEPDECAALLSINGWRLLEDVSYADLAARYLAPTGRGLASTPVERAVFAEKA